MTRVSPSVSLECRVLRLRRSGTGADIGREGQCSRRPSPWRTWSSVTKLESNGELHTSTHDLPGRCLALPSLPVSGRTESLDGCARCRRTSERTATNNVARRHLHVLGSTQDRVRTQPTDHGEIACGWLSCDGIKPARRGDAAWRRLGSAPIVREPCTRESARGRLDQTEASDLDSGSKGPDASNRPPLPQGAILRKMTGSFLEGPHRQRTTTRLDNGSHLVGGSMRAVSHFRHLSKMMPDACMSWNIRWHWRVLGVRHTCRFSEAKQSSANTTQPKLANTCGILCRY